MSTREGENHVATEPHIEKTTIDIFHRVRSDCALHAARAKANHRQSEASSSVPCRRDTVSTGPAVAGPDHGRAGCRGPAEAPGADSSDADVTFAFGDAANTID